MTATKELIQQFSPIPQEELDEVPEQRRYDFEEDNPRGKWVVWVPCCTMEFDHVLIGTHGMPRHIECASFRHAGKDRHGILMKGVLTEKVINGNRVALISG